MQECTKCHKKKDYIEFRKATKVKDGHQSECKECANKKAILYRERNKLQAREYRWKYKEHIAQLRRKRYINNLQKHKDQQLQRTFGISLQEYELMIVQQNNRCKICGRVELKRKLSVDHNHETGKIRGLLCNSCNKAIGLMRDNPQILQAAIQYLQK